MSIYRRVLNYYRPFWPQTLFGLLLSLVSIGLNLLKPWPFKFIVDTIIPRFRAGTHIRIPDQESWWLHDPKALLLGLCVALVLIQFLWGLANWFSNLFLVKTGLEALLKVRTELYSHLQRLSLKFHDARRSTDSSFRVAYDSQAIQTIYNKGFTGIFGSVVTLI